MALEKKELRNFVWGMLFLLPNILGFILFIVGPLLFSLWLAFTNWDLSLHNMFLENSLQWVWFENFQRLLTSHDFWKALGNTMFLMMSIPFSVALSLIAAILLSSDLGTTRKVSVWLISTAGIAFSVFILICLGAGASAMTVLIGGVIGSVLVGGMLGGTTVYRTLFYMPHFTAGVATFLLWKKMYNPQSGPINSFLQPVLDLVALIVNKLPHEIVSNSTSVLAAAIALILLYGLNKMRRGWQDEDYGWASILVGGILILLPACFIIPWSVDPLLAWVVTAIAVIGALIAVIGIVSNKREHPCLSDKGLGDTFMLGAALMVVQFILIGLINVVHHLPAMASDGLMPPQWLTDYHWAKPALMIMALWAGVGSNQMLLYLAGLSNIPPELNEAASIDGASRFQKFWNVTWPQLAPITFFIVVMAVIHGLQGGFEMARAMTEGGPAGATTTLSYYIYQEGFETGRLGYASGLAWTLFLLVFGATLLNWKFGNRNVND